jgi:hypothetical protein
VSGRGKVCALRAGRGGEVSRKGGKAQRKGVLRKVRARRGSDGVVVGTVRAGVNVPGVITHG